MFRGGGEKGGGGPVQCQREIVGQSLNGIFSTKPIQNPPICVGIVGGGGGG